MSGSGNTLRLSIDTARKFVITVRAFLIAICLSGLTTSGACTLGTLHALRWRVLEDKRRKLMAHIHIGTLTTGLAISQNVAILDLEIGLWILAITTQHEFIDKTIQKLTKAVDVMCTVDDVTVTLVVNDSLRTEFTAEVLGGVRWWATQRTSNVRHVRHDRFYTISLTLDLNFQKGHAVTIEFVVHITTDIDNRHTVRAT